MLMAVAHAYPTSLREEEIENRSADGSLGNVVVGRSPMMTVSPVSQ